METKPTSPPSKDFSIEYLAGIPAIFNRITGRWVWAGDRVGSADMQSATEELARLESGGEPSDDNQEKVRIARKAAILENDKKCWNRALQTAIHLAPPHCDLLKGHSGPHSYKGNSAAREAAPNGSPIDPLTIIATNAIVAPMPNDTYAKNIERGLRWAKIEPLPSAAFDLSRTPLAVFCGYEVSHSGSYYWVATGQTPLDLARRIYADPVGRELIRAGGHGGALPPDSQVTWRTPDGRKVSGAENEAKFDALVAEGAIKQSDKDGYVFSDDPASVGAAATVDSYHIDSDLGLRVFADYIRQFADERQ